MNTAQAIGATISGEKFWSIKVTSVITIVISLVALVLGCLSLSLNSLETLPAPLLLMLFLVLLALYFLARRAYGQAKRSIIVFAILSLVSAIILHVLPEYLKGFDINGIIHRSFISALILMAITVPSICFSVYYLLDATPRAHDISRYPVLLFPIIIGLAAYALIIFNIISEGAPKLNWSLLTTPFLAQYTTSEVWENGWPTFISKFITQTGMRNHILGTFLLMGLTCAISLPIGLGVGIYRHQYAGRKMAGIVNFSSTALRSISGIILAITALNLLRSIDRSSFFGYIFHGFGYSLDGALLEGRSSYLFASVFISLLVIPLIARATEEGFNSLPRDIWEGSLGLGASKEHTLLHILLPWSLPNIITGVVLGCAEAAGALTIIFLIAGTGEYGVSPLHETTSLAYLIFDCRYGKELGDQVQTVMGSYQYTAAFMLLVITVGLTVSAMILKNKTARRYKQI